MFIHYSNANIHDVSLLEALEVAAVHEVLQSQPFNGNRLRPCPMLKNPYELGRMVAESGAHGTDLVEPETPEELRRKTLPGASRLEARGRAHLARRGRPHARQARGGPAPRHGGE